MKINASECPREPLLLDTLAAAAFVGVGKGVIRRWVSEGLPFVRAGSGGKKMSHAGIWSGSSSD